MTRLAFIEATADGEVGRFRVVVIASGLSLNGTYYLDKTLRESVRRFDGARVFAKSDDIHLRGLGKDINGLVGRIEKPVFVEGKAPDTGAIEAELQFIDPDHPIAVKVREAVKRGMTDLFGLSIDATGGVRLKTINGKLTRVAESISAVNSVDLIVEPGAGGKVVSLLESQGAPAMDDVPLSESAASAMVQVSGLPASAQKRVLQKFKASDDKTEAALRESVADAKAFLADAGDSGHVRMGDLAARPARDEAQPSKADQMLDAFFDPEHKDHRHARSFRECYVEITGDKRCTGAIQNFDESRYLENIGRASFRESLDSGSWSFVLGNSITRRMVKDYLVEDQYSVWRRIADVVPVGDFRQQERTRFGGYGDLPIVNEGNPYLQMASPTDEKATYTIQKRGGTEDITLEMIKNDDVRSIQKIPVKLSRAAKRTLSKFVFDFVRTNPQIYDGIVWFHASHGNLSTAALDAAAFAAARLLMLKATEKDTADRLGIPPKTLLVPVDLQEAAFNLFQRATENDKKFIATITPDIVPVWYWTDATDWALFADPNEAAALEIGFLDGQEEPELFVQDMPTVGSMFSNDKLTYKIRHIYGGNVVDFRPAVKSVQ